MTVKFRSKLATCRLAKVQSFFFGCRQVHGSLAQAAEHQTFNLGVVGSNPT